MRQPGIKAKRDKRNKNFFTINYYIKTKVLIYRKKEIFSLCFAVIIGEKMPTYEYKCTECNHLFEIFQKMTDEYLKECPKCGGVIKRLIGAGSGPIFKGSGFYQTDYKNSSVPKSSEKLSDNSKNTDTKSTESAKSTEGKTTEVKKESAKKEDK